MKYGITLHHQPISTDIFTILLQNAIYFGLFKYHTIHLGGMCHVNDLLSLSNSSNIFLKGLNVKIKQLLTSSRPGKLIDCRSDKAICTNTVNFLKFKITYGLVARLN